MINLSAALSAARAGAENARERKMKYEYNNPLESISNCHMGSL